MENGSVVNEIKAFAERYLSPEMLSELDASLGIFDAFDTDSFYQNIQNILYDESVASMELRLGLFINEFIRALDEILKAHSIEVTADTSMHQRNQLLAALYRFQHYEDNASLLRLLESPLQDDEKLGRVISLLSTLDETVVFEIVESFNPALIQSMTSFLSDKEKQISIHEDAMEHDAGFVLNLKQFFTFFGKDNLATEIVNTEMDAGYPFDLYVNHFRELLITADAKVSAMNLFSIFMLGYDSYKSPMDAFRSVSESLIDDMALRVKIEAALREFVVSFTNYKEALDVAKRVSSV